MPTHNSVSGGGWRSIPPIALPGLGRSPSIDGKGSQANPTTSKKVSGKQTEAMHELSYAAQIHALWSLDHACYVLRSAATISSVLRIRPILGKICVQT